MYGKFTNKDGVEQNTCDIIATEMQLLGGREGMGAPSGGDEEGGGAPPRGATVAPRACGEQACVEALQRLRRHGRRHPVLKAATWLRCPISA